MSMQAVMKRLAKVTKKILDFPVENSEKSYTEFVALICNDFIEVIRQESNIESFFRQRVFYIRNFINSDEGIRLLRNVDVAINRMENSLSIPKLVEAAYRIYGHRCFDFITNRVIHADGRSHIQQLIQSAYALFNLEQYKIPSKKMHPSDLKISPLYPVSWPIKNYERLLSIFHFFISVGEESSSLTSNEVKQLKQLYNEFNNLHNNLILELEKKPQRFHVYDFEELALLHHDHSPDSYFPNRIQGFRSFGGDYVHQKISDMKKSVEIVYDQIEYFIETTLESNDYNLAHCEGQKDSFNKETDVVLDKGFLALRSEASGKYFILFQEEIEGMYEYKISIPPIQGKLIRFLFDIRNQVECSAFRKQLAEKFSKKSNVNSIGTARTKLDKLSARYSFKELFVTTSDDKWRLNPQLSSSKSSR